ncbi:MAG: hypothetical protein ABSA96_19540 [Candidatus Acidiferrales bacterium]
MAGAPYHLDAIAFIFGTWAILGYHNLRNIPVISHFGVREDLYQRSIAVLSTSNYCI